jgi:hypothetical protein
MKIGNAEGLADNMPVWRKDQNILQLAIIDVLFQSGI